jgi:general secretion pathway protein M
MTGDTTFDRYLARYPSVATLGYVVLVVLLLFVTYSAAESIFDHRAAVSAARTMLDQLEGRRPNAPGDAATSDETPTGSPFLEGQTLTVAGASLLQRVASAVTRVGGNVLSSQVELQGAQAKDGFVGLIVSCEVDQTALQQLLYDLEAGMPFVFVDELSVQAPTTISSRNDAIRLRVLLSVSGQWQGGK